MIEIVQRILDDMKDEPPPSAAVVSDARKRYQEKLDYDVHVPDDDDDDDDDGGDGDGAATLKKRSSKSKQRVELLVERGELFTVPAAGGGDISPPGTLSGPLFGVLNAHGDGVYASEQNLLPTSFSWRLPGVTSLAGVASTPSLPPSSFVRAPLVLAPLGSTSSFPPPLSAQPPVHARRAPLVHAPLASTSSRAQDPLGRAPSSLGGAPSSLGAPSASFSSAPSSSTNVTSNVPRFSGEPGVSHLYRGVGRATMVGGRGATRSATRRGGRATVSTGLMRYPNYSSPLGQEDEEDELEEQSRSRSRKKSRQN